MNPEVYAFEGFSLDVTNRELHDGGKAIQLSARYLDVLVLLVRAQGRLVSKHQFIEQVWRNVPVTDEALTQAIRTIRQQLGDSANHPMFIQTVPKHGYRFIAEVKQGSGPEPSRQLDGVDASTSWRASVQVWQTGTIGSVLAGLAGGLIYGLAHTSGPVSSGEAGISSVLVYICITAIIALLGGGGVCFGIAVAFSTRPAKSSAIIVGGAAGGLIVGAVVKLLGVDTFDLLLGQAPHQMTGAFEGVLLGTAVGAAAAVSLDKRSLRTAALVGALFTGLAGGLIPILGGNMLGGSLELLAASFPNSRLQLSNLGLFLGENGFGLLSQVVTGALEGMLFGGSTVAALAMACRRTPMRPAMQTGAGTVLGS